MLKLASWAKLEGDEDEQLQALFQQRSIVWKYKDIGMLPPAISKLKHLRKCYIMKAPLSEQEKPKSEHFYPKPN